ncbi:hypothetical protein ACF1BN_20290 [Streptomyces sp. NPDC014861]|uniref:hypothetical protein n=1 Tax=Streptomyces sp. NPDC014861 TaxID=3364923 RepID=UPI0037023569
MGDVPALSLSDGVDVMRHQICARGPLVTTYTIDVVPPKPEFFGAGKAYQRFTG